MDILKCFMGTRYKGSLLPVACFADVHGRGPTGYLSNVVLVQPSTYSRIRREMKSCAVNF